MWPHSKRAYKNDGPYQMIRILLMHTIASLSDAERITKAKQFDRGILKSESPEYRGYKMICKPDLQTWENTHTLWRSCLCCWCIIQKMSRVTGFCARIGWPWAWLTRSRPQHCGHNLSIKAFKCSGKYSSWRRKTTGELKTRNCALVERGSTVF